ncbi:hypothetical protein K450DRAFT_202076 [Umbelopsis ramanniana AG]|uniref:Reverse transcriptase domain-containing protein n=1 Tax=Umbelopsis ramanniana AG TaxID=1314678 RepID=A0AAD5E378_UMBRA|nr:uncharacterized protein K450DRAFT_202076 [Umbelopsis ramanniana AG]KAI8576323.1 hypothetical protein K450DRAFT_202076 [Umbelopsis ramanniana AG]
MDHDSHHLLNHLKVTPSPPSLTDHSILTISLETGAPDHGPGWWKLNTNILASPTFQRNIRDFLEFCFNPEGPFGHTTPKLLDHDEYDSLKYMLRKLCMDYSAKQQRKKKKHLLYINSEINRISEIIPTARTSPQQQLLQSLLTELDKIELERLEGQAIRSRILWREQGEKSTAYFFRTLKSRQAKAQMTSIDHPHTGVSCDTTTEILEATTTFYKDLFTPSDIPITETRSFLQHTPANVFSEEEKQECIRPILRDEILDVVNSSPNQKAPGNDGIPFEFYKTFQNSILIDILTSQCNQTLKKAHIPESWNSTNTVLIHKKNCRRDLRNWRPIALVNADSKIFSKVLSNRIQQTISLCIDQYQTGFVRGRYIADNAAAALLLMEHAERTQKKKKKRTPTLHASS